MSVDDRDDDDDGQRRAALEVHDDAIEALRRATLAVEGLTREVDALKARVSVLVDALVDKQILAPGHLRLMDNEAKDAAQIGPRARVSLRVLEDKTIDGAEIDCASRIAVCQARCCTLQVTLTEDEVAAGLAWEIHEPYLLRREVDGRCTYTDRGTGGCTAYQRRPFECRVYDCRNDPRIWIDFDKRIATPLPRSLRRLQLTGAADQADE